MAGPEFEVYVTDRTGDVNRRMYQYTGLSVEHPLNDARTCKFTCPITDINALRQSNVQHLRHPLGRFVKVFYRGYLVFWGPIVKPIFNFAENKVEVNAHDPSFYWKYHHFSEDDGALDEGVKVNGEGAWDLVSAARLNAAETATGAGGGYPPDLIVEGDTEDYFFDPPEDSSDDRRRYPVHRGDNVFEALQAIAEVPDGPDWQLVPIDERNDPDEVWTDGAMAMFRAVEEQSVDRYGEVIFHYGWGRMNAQNFIYEPDGTTVVNRQVIENQRGVYRVTRDDSSIHDLGIMEGWGSAGGKHPNEASMDLQAESIVGAYSRPLDTFTVEPMWEQGLMGSAVATPWRYPSGFQPGDWIRVLPRLGDLELDLAGRITKVTLNQLNEGENAQTQIEARPESSDEFDYATGDSISP